MAWRFKRVALRLGILALGAGVAAVIAVRTSSAQHPATPQADPVAGGVPATVAKATRQDVPIYATGVGNVEAYQAVQIRARVDGYVLSVPVTEGQDVKQGDLIAVIDPRPFQAVLDQAKAKKAQDEAALANARLDLVRFQTLGQQDFASRQQIDTQQALVNQDIASIAGDVAAIESAQLNVDYCFIKSPVDGRVGIRLVDPGNLVQAAAGTTIISIMQIHPISATFTLPQDELVGVQADMRRGKLPVLAYAGDDHTELDQGTLLTPDNMIDTTTGTIRLKATFPNPQDKLWPGLFINAHLQIGTAHDAVTVPPDAIQHGPDGLYVYVVGANSTVSRQPITAGYQTAQLAIVTKGLNGGEAVVVSGQSRLQAGTRIAVR
jgi:multidrug efflux system membrane fusion protein